METCLGSTLGLSPRPDPPGPTVDPALGPGPIGAVESNPLYHLDHKSLNSQIPLRAEGIGPPSITNLTQNLVACHQTTFPGGRLATKS